MTEKILICDDEEGIRESLKLILENHYNLIIASDGTSCLEYLKNIKDISLILLDINMPNRSGLDILEEIKKKYPHLKIIVVTGYRSVDTTAEAVRLGVSDYIVKPFKVKELLDTVKNNLTHIKL